MALYSDIILSGQMLMNDGRWLFADG